MNQRGRPMQSNNVQRAGNKPPEPPKLDLNKVQNVPGKQKKSSKFDFREAEMIPLPSKGRLYSSVTDDKDILNGYIKMYPMTVKEEEILSTSRFLKAGIATRMVLDNCIASNIDAKDILLFDSNFLLFYLRSMSYGDEYKFKIKCTNSGCEREFEHKVEISKLEFEELPDDVNEPITVTLPKCGYTVSFVLPRLAHSEEIYAKNKKRKKSTTDADQSMVDNLVVTSVKITAPDGTEVPMGDWEEFYEALIGLDRATLKEASNYSTGVDELKGVACPYCGEEISGGSIPVWIDFFRF
jgi:hypothetical protein